MNTTVYTVYIYFADTSGGTPLGCLFIGVVNPTPTLSITDYVYSLDESPLSYHNVKRIHHLEAHDQCMCMHSTRGSGWGSTWFAGEWADVSCSSKMLAVCEGNKVGAVLG